MDSWDLFTNIPRDCFTTVYPKKYAHGFCFAVLCCGYTLTDFPISIRLISLALWQSNDCPSASKATLMNMDKYFMWIHYERLHNHNKAKHNKTVCIFLGIYSMIPAIPLRNVCKIECKQATTKHYKRTPAAYFLRCTVVVTLTIYDLSHVTRYCWDFFCDIQIKKERLINEGINQQCRKRFPHHQHLLGESTSHRWIPQ